MKFNRCVKCMAETESYPCPHCGYNGEQNKDYMLPIGSILNGRYLVGRALGQGGFGITYVGWDLMLNQKLAIKEFYPGGQATRTRQTGISVLWSQTDQGQKMRQTGLKTVLHEAQKMAKLENVPEAVHVRDVFRENDTAYIVMDFIEGETLQAKLKREGPMLWKDARKLFLPLIAAMEKVHAAGIIHRDLSPDNFMIQPNGRVRILDLGAAKDVDVSTGASTALVIKSGFSPLEQYATRGGSGTWTDVYAMAATIVYALTGQVPPAATDRLEGDTLNLNGLPAPTDVIAALQKALTVSAKARTQTMEQLKKDLVEVPKPPVTPEPPVPPKPPVSPTPPTPPESPAPPKSRKKMVILVAAAATVCVIAIALFSGSKRERSGHTWVAATCTTPKTCSVCGETEGTALGHSWKTATCTTPKTCSVCGETSGSASGHSWVAATCTTPKTCSVCGETSGSASGHNWKAATCTTPKTCSVCGETSGSAAGHNWVDATYDTPKTCNVCGETEGYVKGYTPSVSVTSSNKITIKRGSNTYNVYEYYFSSAIKNCKKLTLWIEMSMNSGTSCKDWAVYARVDGTVKEIGTITLPDGDGEGQTVLTFDEPINLEAIVVIPKANGSYSWNWTGLSVTDVYTTG